MLGGNSRVAAVASRPSSGGDFNTTILTRLKQVEQEAKDARSKLAEQIMINEKLRQENDTLKALVNNPDEAVREADRLRRQVTQLKVKIEEMETFLGDYGLVWVGNNHPKGNEQGGEDDQADVEDTSGHAMSFADFNMQIDELNSIIYSEPAQVVKEGSNQRKARLVQSSELLETVRIVFYRNGLMIKRGPFRACDSPGYRSFVKDVMDGYFPSEFQAEYPDGVIFDLKDQHSVEYVEGKTDPNFDQPQMSRAQFLNRLPKTVIHKGQVVGVRGDIAELLGDSGAGEGGAGGAAVSKPKVVIESTAGGGDKTHSEDMGEAVKIQVKWVDQSAFIVNMCALHTVGDLKTSIRGHFAAQQSELSFDFELRSAFPPRALELTLSLKDAGLAPNGTVHARMLA
jgi:hypothetical protein